MITSLTVLAYNVTLLSKRVDKIIRGKRKINNDTIRFRET